MSPTTEELMKSIKLLALLLAVSTMSTACTFENEHGKCIGVIDAQPEPGVQYEYDMSNLIVSAIFFEMIFPPIVWGLAAAKCPVSKK
jgi:hypothetical protein